MSEQTSVRDKLQERGRSAASWTVTAAKSLFGISDDASEDEVEDVVKKMLTDDMPLRKLLSALDQELMAGKHQALHVTHIELEFNGNSLRNIGASFDPGLPFGVKLGKTAVEWAHGRSQNIKVRIEIPKAAPSEVEVSPLHPVVRA